MDLEVGAVLEGKVTGITKFGAFVSFPSGKSGLVHISEIAYPYVQNVSDHLADGQTVKVKVIGIDENGRINLSIKKAAEQPNMAPRAPQVQNRNQKLPVRAPTYRTATSAAPQPVDTPTDISFEDKLKRFMQDSDSKISSLKQYTERKSGPASRRRSKS